MPTHTCMHTHIFKMKNVNIYTLLGGKLLGTALVGVVWQLSQALAPITSLPGWIVLELSQNKGFLSLNCFY